MFVRALLALACFHASTALPSSPSRTSSALDAPSSVVHERIVNGVKTTQFELDAPSSVVHERIVNGVKTTQFEFPYQVLIGIATADGICYEKCGGSIIGPDTILTAAHCQGKSATAATDRYFVWSYQWTHPFMGTGYGPATGAPPNPEHPCHEEKVEATMTVHPTFELAKVGQKGVHDVAILKLSRPLKCTSPGEPGYNPDMILDLSSSKGDVAEGTDSVTDAGFGAIWDISIYSNPQNAILLYECAYSPDPKKPDVDFSMVQQAFGYDCFTAEGATANPGGSQWCQDVSGGTTQRGTEIARCELTTMPPGYEAATKLTKAIVPIMNIDRAGTDPSYMMKGSLKTVSLADATAAGFAWIDFEANVVTFAGASPNKVMPCSGDSGGPAVVTSKAGKPLQVGLNSFVIGPCGGETSGTVLTRVSSVYDWIMSTSGMSTTPKEPPLVKAPTAVPVGKAA